MCPRFLKLMPPIVPPQLPGCQKTRLDAIKQKSPALQGFDWQFWILSDFFKPATGGEGGIRTRVRN